MKRTTMAMAGLIWASGAALAADAGKDEAMLKLAAQSGCLTCHQVEPGGKGPDGMAPIGPAWREVALKYKGDKKAPETLLHTVLTGSNPYESHWKGKVSGLAMPPNKVAITEPDAKKLVGWILKLDPPKP
jgi:cytochrome c